jgi:hypothetical protein
VIVDNLDVEGVSAAPHETYAPLVVDANAVLTRPVALECLKPVSRWDTKIVESFGSVEEHKFSESDTLNLTRDSPRPTTLEQEFRVRVAERTNHAEVNSNGIRYALSNFGLAPYGARSVLAFARTSETVALSAGPMNAA